VLTILGLGLAAYIAWTGILAAQRMPIALITIDGVKAVHRRTAQVVSLVLTALQVAIVLLLLLEIA
jgi:hypothetical protein